MSLSCNLHIYYDCLEVCTHSSPANQGPWDSFLRSAVTTGLDHPTQGVGRGQRWNLEEPQVLQSGFPVLAPLALVLPLSQALSLILPHRLESCLHQNPFQGLVWQIPQGRGQRRNLLTQTQAPQSGFPVLTDGFGVQSLQVGLSQGRILDPDHGPQGIVQVVEEDFSFQCLGAGQVGEKTIPIPYPDNQKGFPVQADIDSLQVGRGRG